MGSKRGRLLIRQPRIKKELEQGTQGASDMDTSDTSLYSQCLLTVPSGRIIERHVSEPAPGTISVSSHQNLLAIPTSSLLIKQHSHPVLPSQSHSPPTTYALHRQLSHPLSSSSGLSHSSSQGSATNALTTLSITSPSYTISSTPTIIKTEKAEQGQSSNPMVVIIPDASSTSGGIASSSTTYTITSVATSSSQRLKPDDLHRSISTPAVSIDFNT